MQFLNQLEPVFQVSYKRVSSKEKQALLKVRLRDHICVIFLVMIKSHQCILSKNSTPQNLHHHGF